ncbi:sulfurtransferase [uncultured Polaribacter sp.]|uniref:sulfurtransferase n=1 Tax=uncultured Polaribacter sp. TaxID=174711 RepID=UPI00262CB872|nr:sulfurtransferase [uncultured Polaribacter sp.]
MLFKNSTPLVSVNWLYNNLTNKKLVILDATIPKVTGDKLIKTKEKEQIKGAIFFDIKNVFSNKTQPFPNTVLSAEEFEKKAQNLGIQKNSFIVVYDDLGIYSSPRVWWLFQLMGFNNVVVLDGGFPEWKSKEYPTEKPQKREIKQGYFKTNYQTLKIKFLDDVLLSINNDKYLIVDARSKGRFYATDPEPRADVKSGHIPNSINLPHSEIISHGKLKSKVELKEIFNQINPNNKELIFSCGSGITASVLALGAEIAEIKNYAVYDGSWTEWGSTENLPIEI